MATKRRGKNEGTVFPRKNGKWTGRVSLGYDPVTGERRTKTVYGVKREDVNRKVAALLADHQKGLAITTKEQTLAQFLDHWLEECVKGKKRPSTTRSYEQIIRNHLKPGLGRYQLNRLTPQIAQSFVNEKAKSGISVEHLRRVLRAALSQAMKWDLVGRNVASLVEVPKREKRAPVFLTTEEAVKLIRAAKGDRLEALITVGVSSGLRLGELLGLKWEDVDFEVKLISIRRQVSFATGKAEFGDTKTVKSRRVLPIPDFVVESLLAHRSRQLEERMRDQTTWQENGLVFASTVGTPLDARNVRRSLATILSKSGLPPMRVHDLRHSTASIMLELGADMRVIMETLGHSQIAVTANTYTHVAQTLQRGIADKMQAKYESAANDA